MHNNRFYYAILINIWGILIIFNSLSILFPSSSQLVLYIQFVNVYMCV